MLAHATRPRTIMPKHLLRIGLAALCLAALAPAQLLPTGLSDDLLASGLSNPIALAFLPDGRILICEQETHLVVVRTPAGALATIGMVSGVQNDPGEHERGLLAIAVDPQWPTRPYAYFWSSRGPPDTMWLTMITLTGDLSDPLSTNLALGAEYIIFNDLAKVSATHNGGTIRFGPDGMLYLSTGEDYQYCPAQDLGSGLGKILRIDVSTLPGPGSGPPPKSQIAAPGNPFSGPNDWASLVWSYGLRSPFRFHIDAMTSNLMVSDVGEVMREEIDFVNGPGQNFGWPWFEGNVPNIGCGGTPPAVVAPVIVHSPSSGFHAVISLGFYRNQPNGAYDFGAGYEGDYFYSDYYSGVIRRLHHGSAWAPAGAVPGQPAPANWGANYFFVTDAVVGPDGALYYAKHIPGELRRIRGSANQPAISAHAGNNQAINAGQATFAPLTARLQTSGGAPIAGVPVTFTVTTGGGQVGPQPVLTDAMGLASTTYVASVTDPTNPVVSCTASGAGTATFNLEWRGILMSYETLTSTVTVTVQHSEPSSPLTVVFEIPPPPAPLAMTPWGPIWTTLLAPGPGLLAIDGLGLLGPPVPGVASGPVIPTWTLTVPGLPSLGGVPVIGQAYGIDVSRVPAPDAYFVSNPATIVLP
jgi:glucose/arabinose dehydrogenase